MPVGRGAGGYKEIKVIEIEEINFVEPKIKLELQINADSNIQFEIVSKLKENK